MIPELGKTEKCKSYGRIAEAIEEKKSEWAKIEAAKEFATTLVVTSSSSRSNPIFPLLKEMLERCHPHCSKAMS